MMVNWWWNWCWSVCWRVARVNSISLSAVRCQSPVRRSGTRYRTVCWRVARVNSICLSAVHCQSLVRRSGTRYQTVGWRVARVNNICLSAVHCQSLVRRSGTRYRIVSVTQFSAATDSDNRWRRIYFVTTTQHTQCSRDASRLSFSFSFGVAHALFTCQRWALPHRLAQCVTKGLV